jgi:hypothetical protein
MYLYAINILVENIRGWRMFVGGECSWVENVRGWRMFVGGECSQVENVRVENIPGPKLTSRYLCVCFVCLLLHACVASKVQNRPICRLDVQCA